MLICDHCGKMLNKGDTNKYSVEYGKHANELAASELCDDCASELSSIITKYITNTKSKWEEF